MDGPQHYAEAQRLIGTLPAAPLHRANSPQTSPTLALAQVHATLALAGAQIAVARATDEMAGAEGDYTEWDKAMGRTSDA